MMARVG